VHILELLYRHFQIDCIGRAPVIRRPLFGVSMKRVLLATFAVFLVLAVRIAPAYGQDGPDSAPSGSFPAVLVISNRASEVVAEIPLQNGRFDLVFIHSFHLTPVAERFQVVEAAGDSFIMHLFELEYESPGVGMPADAENGYRLVDGKFLLAMDRDFAVIPLMVSIVAGHGVIADGLFRPFTDWVPPETMLFLAVKAASGQFSGGKPE